MAEDKKPVEIDYSLNNPDTLTKYKTAGHISESVLAQVTKLCVPGEKIVEICEKGDKLIDDEIQKVYRGKKINKGFSHPVTVSGSSLITPYTPLKSDEAEAAAVIKEGEPIKIQLGAQIDGFGTIVCDTIFPKAADATDAADAADGADAADAPDAAQEPITGREADLILATHYANEVLIRLMIPPGLLAQGSDEEKAKAAAVKPPTQSKITVLLEKVVKTYDCNLVESTTSWLFDRNEIEGDKKIVLAPGEGVKGEGVPGVGEVWGVEMGVSLGSGKVKVLDQRATLHRRTKTQVGLKRPTSRKILSEVQKKYGTFPFSLRQLDDERDAKSGVIECVRAGVFRQYEAVGDKDSAPVARLLTTVAITKNGLTRLGGPPPFDPSRYQSDTQITDEEILKILEQPLARNTGKKNKNKKKAKKAKKEEEDGDVAEDDAAEDDAAVDDAAVDDAAVDEAEGTSEE